MTNIPKADDQVDQWRSVMFLYDSALKKVNTKIEILNNEFANRYDYNPIEHIKSRLKSAESIVMKLKKDGYEVTIENMMECLSDIAGIRIICSLHVGYLPDSRHDSGSGDVTVLHVKDYIKKPQAQRIQKLSYGSNCAGLSHRWTGGDQGGDSNPFRCHGFLGQSGT